MPMQQATLTVFAIYDAKGEGWTKPIYSRNEHTFRREFTTVLQQGNTVFSQHPDDHTVFELGTWNEFEPKINYHKEPLSLGLVLQFMPQGIVTDIHSAA